ncbi:outer membrane protein assembly factor BamE [Methylotenera sp.]|uniref:outer membrane protein assembly factor BamE n=1 Tax=Methylotenera sp. TaxID=2051956 RepID=UPI00248893A0|nr:outer membrane protein assembly factor BamE [Methylotenera sp.]MDI1297900.1 outer membrane protein assembly factor BamE [Methylotenera sp.]
MRIFSTLRYTVILLAVLCASCGTALPTIKPYKLDVQQGNVVTSKMLLQLRPGMTKSQVRFIMGTPLIQDSFHGNRWDYVYQMREKGKIIEQRRVILDFDGESLKTVRGDVIPKGSETKTDEGSTNSGTRVINPTEKPEEKGVLNKLKFWQKDEATLAKEAEAAKAKADAEETAKNSSDQAAEQAKDELARKSATPIEEPKSDEPQSMMAVPLEALPMTADVPAAAIAVEAPAVVEAPPVVAPEKELVPLVEPSPVAEKQAVVEKKIAQPVVDTPANIEPVKVESIKSVTEPLTPYESTSGMKFDRNLKLTEAAEVEAASVPVAPRAGNKSVPKPKDLPTEGTPSFFDRMLEKIGF